jgi:hypothetical protein
MESSTLPDASVISATADIVAVASHVDNDHKSVEVVEKGERVKRCTIYPNLSCDDHIRTSEVGKLYLKGRFAAPVSIWCDAAGRELFRKSGLRRPDAFLEDLKEAAGRVTGPRIAKAEYDKQALPLEEAEAALGRGKYRIAIEGFTAAAKGTIEPLKVAAENGLAGVKRTGEQLLARGRSALKSGRTAQARELFTMMAVEFAALDCGREAAELLKSSGGDDKDRK